MLKQRKAKRADEIHKIAKQLSHTGPKATQALKIRFVGMLIFESCPQLVKYWWFGTVPKPTYDPRASLFEELEEPVDLHPNGNFLLLSNIHIILSGETQCCA